MNGSDQTDERSELEKADRDRWDNADFKMLIEASHKPRMAVFWLKLPDREWIFHEGPTNKVLAVYDDVVREFSKKQIAGNERIDCTQAVAQRRDVVALLEQIDQGPEAA